MILMRKHYMIQTLVSKWSSSSTLLRQRSCNMCILKVKPEVQEALSSQQPVVALESTIITHGMPFPHNLNTARTVEDIIRNEGAVPATIAILEGQVHVGLSHTQLHTLATSRDQCVKTSRRDFPYVLAKGLNGGTTVSGTMLIAHKANIPIFVTGGIGGVHRGGEKSLDVSADLMELGRTPVTVVAAGVKSILDIGRTLEYLETQGVCVTVLGDSTKFPDFFTSDSGYDAPSRVESTAEVAAMMVKRAEFRLDSGMLVAVPIPQQYQAEGFIISQAIETAVKEAESSVRGRDVTPYILQKVSEITQGQSLEANIALIKNNAKVGARIAAEYVEMQFPSPSFVPAQRGMDGQNKTDELTPRPVVAGGSIVDIITTVREPQLKLVLSL
ncbi:hypothetical protein Pmani_008121 [Petrolisthes manimaculis]|uniref:Pseudouridine-5'-phosphate glycosidase n=1 Tax=Petrolisthes manimaculis TaxID=1843537 RepID=A0AAE1UI13_9EUCA|nr:hypothetical protein Pmani_008121 [Petrolisthes manimaculis]